MRSARPHRTAALDYKLAYVLDVEQQCCGGLNFGYFYDRSPIIAYDGAAGAHPTCDGHFHLDHGAGLPRTARLDRRASALSTTTRWGPGLCAAAPRPHGGHLRHRRGGRWQRGLPLAVLDVRSPESVSALSPQARASAPGPACIAWRGDAEPATTRSTSRTRRSRAGRHARPDDRSAKSL